MKIGVSGRLSGSPGRKPDMNSTSRRCTKLCKKRPKNGPSFAPHRRLQIALVTATPHLNAPVVAKSAEIPTAARLRCLAAYALPSTRLSHSVPNHDPGAVRLVCEG